MSLVSREVFFEQMNLLYQKKRPFFFLIDFEQKKTILSELDKTAQQGIFFSIGEKGNLPQKPLKKPLIWEKFPISYKKYLPQFEKVSAALHRGDSYLVNLTCSTPVKTNYSLKEMFLAGKAKYKLLYKNEFVHFSPEPFVTLADGKINSFPMKGTIDAGLENAARLLLENEKELREQATIVDLIRNDLSRVADDVKVEKFRYIEKIFTNQKSLLTNSSHISGTIKPEYKDKPGDIFAKLLPAGSISGAPKQKTLEIIRNAETHQRNFYTGIWGISDGENTDSCVIIRYLENTENGLIFKSGGGITSLSNPQEEYQEMIDKVYIPVY